MSKTLRNKFFPPQPKAEALVYSQGSNQQSKALGLFPIPHAIVPCMLAEDVSPKGTGSHQDPRPGCWAPPFLAETTGWAPQHPGAVRGVPQPSWKSPHCISLGNTEIPAAGGETAT